MKVRTQLNASTALPLGKPYQIPNIRDPLIEIESRILGPPVHNLIAITTQLSTDESERVKLVLNKWSVTVWTRFKWLRKGPLAGSYEYGGKPSCYIKD
jgi:hypothetical protein